MQEETERDASRIDAILKIDANAVLNTIRDLERRLAEREREKPSWALALEARLERIEKHAHSAPNHVNSQLTDATSAEAKPDTLQPASPEKGNNAANGGLTMSSLASEDRVMSKTQALLDARLASLSLQQEALLGAQQLEMERVHRLLSVRPTTAELQQVVLMVHACDDRTRALSAELQASLLAQVRVSVAEEMDTLLQERRSARVREDEQHRLTEEQLRRCAQDVSETRAATEDALQTVRETQIALQRETQSATQTVYAVKESLDRELEEMRKALHGLQRESTSLRDALHENRRLAEENIAQSESRLQQELQRVSALQASTDERLAATRETLLEIEGELIAHREHTERELAQLTTQQELTTKHIDVLQQKTERTVSIVEEFTAMDFPAKFARQDEKVGKLTYDLHDLAQSVQHITSTDLKGINVKISVLQEQCNVRIPTLFDGVNERLTGLDGLLASAHTSIDALRVKQSSTDEVVDGLLPLQASVHGLHESQARQDEEITELKLGLTTALDNNSECARRIEELEETIDSLDDTISARMNKIRDTLMENLLEKQGETHAAVKHVKENLDAIAEAGDHPAPHSRRAKHTVHRSGNLDLDSVHSLGSGSRNSVMGSVMPHNTAVSDMARRNTSYRVPTMHGQVVQGQQIDNHAPAATPYAAHNNAPMNSAVPMASHVSAKSPLGLPVTSHGSGRPSVAYPGQAAPSGVIGRPRVQQQQSYGAASSTPVISGTPSAVASRSTDEDPQTINNTGYVGIDNPEREVPHSLAFPSEEVQRRDVYSAPIGLESPPRTADTSSEVRTVAQPVVYIGYSQRGSEDEEQDPLVDEYAQLLGPNNQPSHSHAQGAAVMMDAFAPHNALSQPSFSEGQMNMNANNNNNNADNTFFGEAQFLADLCSNYEEISVKKKRVTNVPPVLCENVASVASAVAESVAGSADFEMVQLAMAQVAGTPAVTELRYDEFFVVTRRAQKLEQFLDLVTALVTQSQPTQQIGVVRLDARTLFFALLKKALELFLTKHNQVLVVGNSRLGRIKIPTCIACDRPLLQKTQLDSVSLAAPSQTLSPSPSPSRHSHTAHTQSLGVHGSALETYSVDNGQDGSERERAFNNNNNNINSNKALPAVFDRPRTTTGASQKHSLSSRGNLAKDAQGRAGGDRGRSALLSQSQTSLPSMFGNNR